MVRKMWIKVVLLLLSLPLAMAHAGVPVNANGDLVYKPYG